MHEFGIVDQMIQELAAQWEGRRPPALESILLRYGPGLSEESLRQALQVHAGGTVLEGVRLQFEKKLVQFSCLCGAVMKPDHVPNGNGHSQDDHDNHHPAHEDGDHDHGMPYCVCAECGRVCPIPGFNALEISYAR